MFKILYLFGVVCLAIMCGRELYSTHSGTSAFCFAMMIFLLVMFFVELKKSSRYR